MRWVLAVAACAFGAAGCVTYEPLSSVYDGPDLLPPEMIEALPAVAEPVVVKEEEVVKDRFHFNVRRIVLDSADSGRAIEFEYYDVDDAGRTPVIVLLPIFNGQLIITRYFAKYFANQGWRAVVVTREYNPLDELNRLPDVISGAIADYRRVLDWVEEQPNLDPSRIGLFGVSFGAIDAVMLMALDDRVDALVAAMAGGDFPNLLDSTNYRPVARTFARLLDDSGESRGEMLAALEQAIPMDPLALAPYVDAERVLMIITRSDAIVPFATQQALRESMGAPETLYLPTGHRPSVLYFPKVRTTAFEFYSRQFAREEIAAR
jgi:hypothetical protein